MTHNLYLKMTRKGPTGEILIGEHGEQEDLQPTDTKIEYLLPLPFPHMFSGLPLPLLDTNRFL